MVSVITLLGVFVLIAVRQIGRFRFQIWQVMLLGALVVLLSGQISPSEAVHAIDADVMVFLFCMFILGRAMEESGYLSQLSYRLFGRARSVNVLLILILFGAGTLSAILLNDTLAIIGTPVMLQIARSTGIKTKMLLLTLAFAITIGSVMSPIGNPQNLLVAVAGGVSSPFLTFLRYLAVPTIINLLLTYILIRLFFQEDTQRELPKYEAPSISDPQLAFLSRVSLLVVLTMILLKIILVFVAPGVDFRLTYVAVAGALPIVIGSSRRFQVVRSIDWFTLIFFAAMFVLMESVWESGFFQSVINDLNVNLISAGMILAVSIVLSQFISNVPLVALYLPVLKGLGATTGNLMVLAAGSTIAGNLSILGAASNVIIIQNAERRSGETLTLWEFMRIGVPVTAVNAAVYWLFFQLI